MSISSVDRSTLYANKAAGEQAAAIIELLIAPDVRSRVLKFRFPVLCPNPYPGLEEYFTKEEDYFYSNAVIPISALEKALEKEGFSNKLGIVTSKSARLGIDDQEFLNLLPALQKAAWGRIDMSQHQKVLTRATFDSLSEIAKQNTVLRHIKAVSAPFDEANELSFAPTGWEMRLDSHDEIYYYNRVFKSTQKEHPLKREHYNKVNGLSELNSDLNRIPST